jgi:transcriptional regulator GlxA family with amidase domain
VASATFDDVTAPDVVVVPGELFAEWDDRVVRWLRKVHATTTWTTSVCTGSLYLAAAGVLDGMDATTHWARSDELERLGARYTEQRVVERGKVITAAGVSSGIDMALTLVDRMHGAEMAQLIQLAIEYDPQPPFDAGSPSKAPADMVTLARSRLSPTTAART